MLQNQTISVDVPAGIDDGMTVRVPMQHGELYVTFKVGESKIFTRNGSDVSSDVYVSFAQAILGKLGGFVGTCVLCRGGNVFGKCVHLTYPLGSENIELHCF